MDATAEREFTEFVAARSMALLRTAVVLTGDRHRAEDLVQGALAKLAGRWRKVDDPEAYTRRIIYHDHARWWRRRSARSEVLGPAVPERPEADRSADAVRRLDLRSALQQLGPRQRAVLVLRYLEDLPEAEVAQIMGCSVGTVRSQAHRALARLRTLVPELDERIDDVEELRR
ncbi:SigE family RNA polymerase sigma factor [Jiangella alkaliphila]|uniref:RNA polymerase sigma-70 factor, sigma-E family n=1 Tax=Jiangella alkaliphila TaxID=419479 RepID=A0A1H2J8G8_9ACTN|nr:SigE family RNA polymerase sigma factor [Jiangella alkaliphila]SDU52689.1 RNA polymerase sigma-70 factor, sigma-E family [Jiangella alkaliphila]